MDSFSVTWLISLFWSDSFNLRYTKKIIQIKKVTTSKIKKAFRKPGAVGIKDNKYLPKAIANVKNANKKTIAIFGKENTGKSTLFNKIMNISLSKTSPHLHTTRDSVNWDIQYKNQTLEFIDTAGFIRSRSKRKNHDFEKIGRNL